ncbi:MAG: hypothetical protein ABL923_09960 [Burkholderiaceae bacterium]
MQKTKKLTCNISRCEEMPYLGGRCKVHHEEQRANELTRNAAIETLRSLQIDGKLPSKPNLKDELLKISQWWDKAWMAQRLSRQDSILLDETKSATEWCIALANLISQEERDFLDGREPNATTAHLKKITLERFKNLEAGLMSNGVKRPEKK